MGARKNIPHLDSLNEKQYEKFLEGIDTATYQEKIDGARVNFGWDKNGFFMQTARSNKIRNGINFVDYTIEYGGNIERASYYMTLFNDLKRHYDEYISEHFDVSKPKTFECDWVCAPLCNIVDGNLVMINVPIEPLCAITTWRDKLFVHGYDIDFNTFYEYFYDIETCPWLEISFVDANALQYDKTYDEPKKMSNHLWECNVEQEDILMTEGIVIASNDKQYKIINPMYDRRKK